MKWMIASDLHGSAYYCKKMVEAFEREGADRLLMLGDLLYHGPRNDLPRDYAPKEVIPMLNGLKNKLSAIFATTNECLGIPVTSIFDPSSLPDYASFDSRDCPMCKAGQHIDALVNSFGYSAL